MTRTNQKTPKNEVRPMDYQPQPGNKVVLSLAVFSDEIYLANFVAVVIMENPGSLNSLK